MAITGSILTDSRREWLIRLALVVFCVGLWRNELNFVAFPFLVVAWVLDGGLNRLLHALKQPLVQAILILCLWLLGGLIWSDEPWDGRLKWLKYFIWLLLIPLFALLTKARLPWAIGALIAGYLTALGLGIHQWLVIGQQGIQALNMSYLSFSAMLGAGAIVLAGLACMSRSLLLQLVLWAAAIALIYVQFHQYGRVLLLATLGAIVLQVYWRYRINLRKFAAIFIAIVITAGIFAYTSPAFQERIKLAQGDIELLQQGNFSSSLGYRLAMWDVGLHAIAEHPWTGLGTGAPARYFDTAIQTYKDGLYRDLPAFQKTSHYHNDWIEIGMHIGIPGMLILLLFYWGWYQAFHRNGLAVLGIGLVSYAMLAGQTDAFLIFSRMPVLLLSITAIAMAWQRQPADT